MPTRISVKARLLDYALTRTTSNEHWHLGQYKDHTVGVNAGRLTKLLTDLWWLRISMTHCLTRLSADVFATGFPANCTRCPKDCFALELHDAAPCAEHSPFLGSVKFCRDFRENSTSTKARGLVIRQLEEVEVRRADLLIHSTTMRNSRRTEAQTRPTRPSK